MIAEAKPPFRPSEMQRSIKRILENMTGFGVKIMPVGVPVGDPEAPTYFPSVDYVFKCEHADLEAAIDIRAKEAGDFYQYITQLLMTDTGAGYDSIHIAFIADPDDPKNGIWPCVRMRFSGLSGAPHVDGDALKIAEEMERKLNQHVQRNIRPAQLDYYRIQVKGDATFKDAYANELGRG